MDSLSQALLGAAVGEVTLGRKVGRRALAWGAFAGTLPDLDILAYPFLSPVGELYFHRGPTHALLFAPIVAPILGYLVWRLYASRGSPAADAGWRGWAKLFFWGLFTPPLLDTLTVYGTQLFRPFSDLPAAVPALFIIDPAYTLPLAVAVIACVVLADERRRWRVAWLGLGVSSLYAAWALGVKAHVGNVVERNLVAQGIEAEATLTVPAPLQTILWNVIVDVDDAFLVGTYGLLDSDDEIVFRRVEQRAARLDPYRGTEAVDALLWFSRGYFIMRPDSIFVPDEPATSLGFTLNDIRFGRADGYLSEAEAGSSGPSYIFPFRLVREPDDEVSFRLGQPDFDSSVFPLLLARIFGDETPVDPTHKEDAVAP